jgi:hypothetical protein
VASSPVFAGQLGTSSRFEYTAVIGDVVIEARASARTATSSCVHAQKPHRYLGELTPAYIHGHSDR